MSPSAPKRLLRASLLLLVLLNACGPGLVIDGSTIRPDDAGARSAVFRITFTETSLRKNDCGTATLQIVDDNGATITDTDATVSVTASDTANVHIYSSLLGCQTNNSSEEVNQVSLSAASPSATLYVRTDDDALADVRLTARSTDSEIEQSTKIVPVDFERFYYGKGPAGEVYRVVNDPLSDKVYAVGSFAVWNNTLHSGIVRLNADGSLDDSFIATGPPAGDGSADYIFSVYPLADGKILVGGNFLYFNGVSRPYIARLNSDGSLDNTFVQTGSGLNGAVLSIAVQNDGQILVGGGFGSYNGVAQTGVARLNTDGSRDMSFAQTGTGLSNGVASIALQADGRIVAGGLFANYNGTARRGVARLNANGTLDGTFVPTGTGLNGDVNHVALASGGGILVVGGFQSYNGTSRRYVAKLTSSGSLDGTFATTGTGLDSAPRYLLEQGDGAILLGGAIQSYDGTSRRGVLRLTATGALDNTFSFAGTGISGLVSGLAFDDFGQLIVGGSFTGFEGTSRRSLLALDSDGSLIDDYGPVSETLDTIGQTMAVQSDRKVLLAGYFDKFGDTARSSILRLNTDGTLDTTFVPAGAFSDYTGVLTLSLHSDGRILVGGSFTDYNLVSTPFLVRFNSDGSVDSTFTQTGTGLENTVRAAIALSDNKALVAGDFVSYNGSSRRRVARLNVDGSLDTTFTQTGTGLNNNVNAMTIQPDGKIIVAGAFTSYNGSARRRVARLNSDGSLDTSFVHTGTGLNGTVNAIALQEDGNIVVGGSFTSYNGTSTPYLARLTSTGQLDTTFVITGTGLNNTVSSVILAPDGRVLAAGGFTSYNGTAVPYMARFQSNGSLDTTFPNAESAPNRGWVYQILFDPDYKLLVLGSFVAVGTSTNQPYFMRTTFDGKLD